MKRILVDGYLRQFNNQNRVKKEQKGIFAVIDEIDQYYGNFTIKTTPMTFCGNVIIFSLYQKRKRKGNIF